MFLLTQILTYSAFKCQSVKHKAKKKKKKRHSNHLKSLKASEVKVTFMINVLCYNKAFHSLKPIIHQ